MSAACAAGSGFGTVWSTTNQPPTATAPSPSSSSAHRPGVPRSTRSCVVLAFSRRSDWPTAGAGPGPRACSPVILAVEGRLRVRASELAVGAEYDVDDGARYDPDDPMPSTAPRRTSRPTCSRTRPRPASRAYALGRLMPRRGSVGATRRTWPRSDRGVPPYAPTRPSPSFVVIVGGVDDECRGAG